MLLGIEGNKVQFHIRLPRPRPVGALHRAIVDPRLALRLHHHYLGAAAAAAADMPAICRFSRWALRLPEASLATNRC